MARTHLLLAVLAAALATGAHAALPTSCPADGATHCSYGVTTTGGAAIIPLTQYNVSALIALENAAGNSFTPGSTGVCSSLTFICNAQLALLYAGNRAFVSSFANACIAQNSTRDFLVTNVQYTAYGTFRQSDCNNLVGGLTTVMALPGMAALITGAVPDLVVCGTDYCTTSGAGRAAAATLALLAAALAAALL